MARTIITKRTREETEDEEPSQVRPSTRQSSSTKISSKKTMASTSKASTKKSSPVPKKKKPPSPSPSPIEEELSDAATEKSETEGSESDHAEAEKTESTPLPSDPAEDDDVDDSENQSPSPHLTSKGKRKVTVSRTPSHSYDLINAYSAKFFSKDAEHVYGRLQTRPIIFEKNYNLASYATIGVSKLIQDLNWVSTVNDIAGYDLELVREFYSNLSNSVNNPKSDVFQKVYVRGEIHEFSPSVISEVLNLPVVSMSENFKVLNLDMVGSSLLGQNVDSAFPISTSQLTIHYKALKHILMHNWVPNVHTPTVSQDIGRFLYVVFTGRQIDLGAEIFDQIVKLQPAKQTQRHLIFPCLITALLRRNKTLQKQVRPTPLPAPYRYSLREVSSTKEGKSSARDGKKSAAQVADQDVIAQLQTTQEDHDTQLNSIHLTLQEIQRSIADLVSAREAHPAKKRRV